MHRISVVVALLTIGRTRRAEQEATEPSLAALENAQL
jgi:hypothetical protein